MPYLTKSAYARLNKISRQAVDDRIKRGKVKLVDQQITVKRVFVSDMELNSVK